MYNNENQQDREAQSSSPPKLNYVYNNGGDRGPSLPSLRSNPGSAQQVSRPSSSASVTSIVSVSPPESGTKLHVQIPNSASSGHTHHALNNATPIMAGSGQRPHSHQNQQHNQIQQTQSQDPAGNRISALNNNNQPGLVRSSGPPPTSAPAVLNVGKSVPLFPASMPPAFSQQHRRASGPLPSSTSPVFLHRIPGGTGASSTSMAFSGVSSSPVSAHGSYPHVSPPPKHNVPYSTHASVAPPPTPFTPSTKAPLPNLASSSAHPAQQATSSLLSSTQRALEITWNTIITSIDAEITKLHSSHAGQIKVWADYVEGLKRESEEAQGLRVKLSVLESEVRDLRQGQGQLKPEDSRTEQIQLQLIAQLQKDLDELKGKYNTIKAELVQREGALSPSAPNTRNSFEWDRLKADLDRVRAERNELRQTRDRLTQDYSNTQQTYAILQTTHSQLVTSHNTLIGSHNNLQRGHAQLKRDFDDLLEREEKAKIQRNIAEEALKKERERTFEVDEARKREKKERKEREREVAELRQKLENLMGVQKGAPKREIIDVEAEDTGIVLNNTHPSQHDPKLLEQPISDIVDLDADGGEDGMRTQAQISSSPSHMPIASTSTDLQSRRKSRSRSASPISKQGKRISGPLPQSDSIARTSRPPPGPSSNAPSRAGSAKPSLPQSPISSGAPPDAGSPPRAPVPRSPLTDYKPLSRSDMHYHHKTYMLQRESDARLNQDPVVPSLVKRSDSSSATPLTSTSPEMTHRDLVFRPRSPVIPRPTSATLPLSLSAAASLTSPLTPASVLLSPSLPHTLPRRPSSTSVATAVKRRSPPRLDMSILAVSRLDSGIASLLSAGHRSAPKQSSRQTPQSLLNEVEGGKEHEGKRADKFQEIEGGEELEVTSLQRKRPTSMPRILSPSPFTSVHYQDPRGEYNEHRGQHQQREWNPAHRDSPIQERDGNEEAQDQGDARQQRTHYQRVEGRKTLPPSTVPNVGPTESVNQSIHLKRKTTDGNDVHAYSKQTQLISRDRDREPHPHKLTKIVRSNGQVVGVASPVTFDLSVQSWRGEIRSDNNRETRDRDDHRPGSRELSNSHYHLSSKQNSYGSNGIEIVARPPRPLSRPPSTPTATPPQSAVSAIPMSISPVSPLASSPTPIPAALNSQNHSLSKAPHPATKLHSIVNPNLNPYPTINSDSNPYPTVNSSLNSKSFAPLNHHPSLFANPIHPNSPPQMQTQLHEASRPVAEGWKKASVPVRGWEVNKLTNGSGGGSGGSSMGVMNMNGSGSGGMSMMSTNGGSSGSSMTMSKGWKTAGLPDQAPSSFSTASSSSGPASAPAPKQLSFKHLELLYETVGGEYVCRECRASSTSTMTKPKSFPTSALSFTELFAHFSEEHKEREEEVLKYSPVKLQEQLVLLKGGGSHSGGGSSGGKKANSKKGSK